MEKKVWVLIDSRAGSNGQARGVAKILNEKYNWQIEEKSFDYNCFGSLPNLLLGSTLLAVKKSDRQIFTAPYPDLVISASRRTAPVARWIKKNSHNQTKIIQLMHPGNVGLRDFDRVFVAEHDRYKKSSSNIYYVTGSAHRVTSRALAEARGKWAETFAALPRPLTAVIVGGAIKSHAFSLKNAQNLAQGIKALKQKEGGSILITTSRRTGQKAQDLIMQELKDIPAHTYLWGVDKGENPYLGYLAWADNIIATGDSVSMCCEACGTGRRLEIFTGEDWLSPKHLRFVESLYEKGLAFPLGSSVVPPAGYQSYNAAEEIVEEIQKLF